MSGLPRFDFCRFRRPRVAGRWHRRRPFVGQHWRSAAPGRCLHARRGSPAATCRRFGRQSRFRAFVTKATSLARRSGYLVTGGSDVPLSASGPLGGLQPCGPYLAPSIGLGPAGSFFSAAAPAHGSVLGTLRLATREALNFQAGASFCIARLAVVANCPSGGAANRQSVELDKNAKSQDNDE